MFDHQGAVYACVWLGLLALLAAVVLDCWRPGRTHSAADGRPLRLNRHCCGVVLGRGLVVPVVLCALLAGVLLDFAGREICSTPLGYCSTISCVCSNEIWQGYVFMFVALTLTPALVIMGVARGSTKFLCCVRAIGCGQYDRLYVFVVVVRMRQHS